MRLFVAIPLSNETKVKLQKLQQSLPDGVRRQQVEQLHITLRFLGDISSDAMTEIKSRLNEIKEKPFKIQINGFGSFPPTENATVLWAGVKKSAPLTKLQRNVEKACIEAGVEAEKRTYIPHITLGRVKKAKSKEVETFIKKHKIPPQWVQPVNEFVLFESKQTEDGITHQPLETYHLKQKL